MENKTLTFKTNINCGGCIARVTPVLDSAEGIENWNVDTSDPKKVLTVTSSGISESEVSALIERVGFTITPLSKEQPS